MGRRVFYSVAEPERYVQANSGDENAGDFNTLGRTGEKS